MYKLIKLWIEKSYEALNGKINRIPAVGYTINYDPNVSKLGGENNGYITFYSQTIQRFLCNKLSTEEQFRAMIVIIVAHELSHIDQAIDYDMYSSDIQYAKSIEADNNKRTFIWLLNNLEYVNSIMYGIDIQFIIDYASKHNINLQNSINLSIYDTIRTQIEPFMNQVSCRFDDMINITLRILRNNVPIDYVVKINGKLGNVENIMNAIREIYRYNRYMLENIITSISSMIIVVSLDESDSYITKHMHSIA
jgi:hypothetical protein